MPETQTLPYQYFVSYAHTHGFGAININTLLPVTTWGDVEQLAKLATERVRSQVVVLNFVLLSGPEHG